MSKQTPKVAPVRVAAVQLAVGADVAKNLETVLRMIDRAAEVGPDLIVLPEFVNHCSWYQDQTHCQAVSLDLGGEFLGAIADRARRHGAYVVANVTLRQPGGRCTGTSLLYDRQGALAGRSDKQVLMGHEGDFLEPASSAPPVVPTDAGRLGLYACMDGVIFETPRALAVRGAQVLCNSLNSFAFDEAALHVPVRAAENGVFVVAANKVGPLIPEALIAPVAAATGIPGHFLSGAGESQIVAPDGVVLARAPAVGEAVVFADIDPALADRKRRADGGQLFSSRRPELYGPIVAEPRPAPLHPAPESVSVAVFQGPDGEGALDAAAQAVSRAAEAGVALVVLPELGLTGPRVERPREAFARGEAGLATLAALAARTGVHVATTVVGRAGDRLRHEGVLIGPSGVALRQPQLHRAPRHADWTNADGGELQVAATPLGAVALVVGDDALYPETFRLAAIAGAHLALVAVSIADAWLGELGLPERAAENRLCLVAAARAGDASTSLVATLEDDFTLLTPWKTRAFDANISRPIVTRAPRSFGLTAATVHPARTLNKTLSGRTDLLNSRPWRLATVIARVGAERA